MFTGLVQRVGSLQRISRTGEGWSLEITHTPWSSKLELGESMAVQGACLTVTQCQSGVFSADILDETLRCTALGNLQKGAQVNLERALTLSDRLGGHLTSGHVDECGTLAEIRPVGRDIVWRISCTPAITRQAVNKGSICIDGVSLTISALADTWIEVNLIPHTLKITSLCERTTGDSLNIESDMIGKYVFRFLSQSRVPDTYITETLLTEQGFIS